ncbi:MAG: glycosyltransferase [archaeon]
MKVCYFGTYERSYSRNQTIINGLKHNNVTVYECHTDIWGKKEHKTDFNLLGKMKFLLNSSISYTSLFFRYMFMPEHDVVIVGYPGQIDMFVAKFASFIRGKPLVFDAYLSLYDSMVNDRKVIKKNSFTGQALHFVDKYSCKLANKVLLDTNEHIKFFSKEFQIPKSKFDRVWIGANNRVFYPRNKRKFDKFTVLFHGKFIPLQGVPYIIEAAKELKDVNFIIIGAGQSFDSIKKKVSNDKLKNIEFKGFLPTAEIADYLAKSHVGLGIFGDTEKARRVIPNKAYEILAMKVPLITGLSKASLEGLEDSQNCLLCEMASPSSLASAILKLKKNENLRREIAERGYQTFMNNFAIDPLGLKVKNILEEVNQQNR